MSDLPAELQRARAAAYARQRQQRQEPAPFPGRIGPVQDWERAPRTGGTVGGSVQTRPPVFPQRSPVQPWERERQQQADWAAGRNIPPRPETVPLNPIYAAGQNVGEVARGLGEYGRDWASQGMPMQGYQPPPVGQLQRPDLQSDRPGLMAPNAPRYRDPPPFPFAPETNGTQFQPEAPMPLVDPPVEPPGRPGFAPPGGLKRQDELEAMLAFEAELARAGIATARERRYEPLPDPRERFYNGPMAAERPRPR